MMGQSLLVTFSIVLGLLIWLGARLAPESSPIARGTFAANGNGCTSCHGQASSSNSLTRPHPIYAGNRGDLLAYFESVRLKRTFAVRANAANQSRLLQGEVLARRYHCFQCHGELGQGGFQNRGALKGYVPGYFGEDFNALTRGGRLDSVRNWIRHGVDRVLYDNRITGPMARYFIEKQEVAMPEFSTLPELEIQILAEYVLTLNQFGAMTADDVREYEAATLQ